MSSPFPQFRAKLLILLLPILRNPERITDFLDGLAIDIVFQVVYLKPRIHHFRLVDGKLRNEPALRHLDIVGFIIVHKRQKLRGVPLAQPGDKQHIPPAADEGIFRMDGSSLHTEAPHQNPDPQRS